MAIKKNKKEATVDDLAIMINKGFDEMRESNAREHKEMRESNAREHKEMTENNAREHEEIKMRLDSVAYRFELVSLEKRVDRLESIDKINTSKLPK